MYLPLRAIKKFPEFHSVLSDGIQYPLNFKTDSQRTLRRYRSHTPEKFKPFSKMYLNIVTT